MCLLRGLFGRGDSCSAEAPDWVDEAELLEALIEEEEEEEEAAD